MREMDKKIVVEGNEYILIKNYRDAFELEEFLNKCTDYFVDYDYIVGDIAYSKLRLKGFYDKSNKKVNKINNFDKLDEYLKINCAPDCRYFIVKKVRENEL